MCHLPLPLKPFVPKKAPRTALAHRAKKEAGELTSIQVTKKETAEVTHLPPQPISREGTHLPPHPMSREGTHLPPRPISRECSDIVPPALRKTDVKVETQPNGSEVTTTIMEFTDQVRICVITYAVTHITHKYCYHHHLYTHSIPHCYLYTYSILYYHLYTFSILHYHLYLCLKETRQLDEIMR